VALSVEEEQQQQPLPISDKSVGVDLGITNMIALSNGGLIESPAFSGRLKRE
jgi:transposase